MLVEREELSFLRLALDLQGKEVSQLKKQLKERRKSSKLGAFDSSSVGGFKGSNHKK